MESVGAGLRDLASADGLSQDAADAGMTEAPRLDAIPADAGDAVGLAVAGWMDKGCWTDSSSKDGCYTNGECWCWTERSCK